jgi:putative oxidoreductase
MFGNMLKHPVDVAAIILRVGVAVVFLFHGYLKVEVGNESPAQLVSGMSATTMMAVGWAELVCAILIAIGLFTRVAALVLIVLQAVAIGLVSGSMMPHVVRSAPGKADYLSIGAEFNLANIAMCLAMIVLGAGHVAVDHVIHKRLAARRGAPVARPLPAAG